MIQKIHTASSIRVILYIEDVDLNIFSLDMMHSTFCHPLH